MGEKIGVLLQVVGVVAILTLCGLNIGKYVKNSCQMAKQEGKYFVDKKYCSSGVKHVSGGKATYKISCGNFYRQHMTPQEMSKIGIKDEINESYQCEVKVYGAFCEFVNNEILKCWKYK